MYEEINFVKTDDNSVGLYSNSVNDIFHSKTGALKEAYDKFVLPLLETKIECKRILDICYGIGYNSKAALKEFYKNNIIIDALEYDKSFVNISPFILDGIDDDELKLFIVSEIFNSSRNIADIREYLDILYKLNLNKFLSPFTTNLKELLHNLSYSCNGSTQNNAFLHNIYYNYISNNMNNNLEPNKYNNCKINFYYGDARKTILQSNNQYDAVFLDAFSSQKDPTLWTIDFLSLVKSKMNFNSLLLSYSKATPYRSALLELGFYVGKIFIDNIDMGTIASLNEKNIKNPLTKYDFDLIKTRSGITFKDDTLSLSGDEILKLRETESKNSNRISHTQFLKKHKKI